jgi:CRISPR/Cas system endoribonuclease Cas6 (RAMP superfamily)
MVDIPTPIPESVVESLGNIWAGSLGDTLWKLSISILIVIGALALLINFGIVGGFVGTILLSALLEDDIRDAVVDFWNRDFAEIEL